MKIEVTRDEPVMLPTPELRILHGNDDLGERLADALGEEASETASGEA
ncbi:MAG: hypothetical protein IT306_09925 [Chloroflexi bacterium]|nr:hypothetical protein [Chloroflexota bacterium]